MENYWWDHFLRGEHITLEVYDSKRILKIAIDHQLNVSMMKRYFKIAVAVINMSSALNRTI